MKQFELNIIAVILPTNMLFNGMQLTGYYAQNQNVSEYTWPIC